MTLENGNLPAMASQATTNAQDKDTDKASRQVRVKARWAMLRNAILQAAASETGNEGSGGGASSESNAHSIHRFPGYSLLQRCPLPQKGSDVDSEFWKKWISSIQGIKLDSAPTSKQSLLTQIEHRVWALDCAIPFASGDGSSTAASMSILAPIRANFAISIVTSSESAHHFENESSIVDVQLLKQRLGGHFNIEVELPPNDATLRNMNESNEGSPIAKIHFARAEQSVRTKFMSCRYSLDTTNLQNSEHSPSTSPLPIFLFTREPQPNMIKLSLQQLVCHRQPATQGVDNTGNICVWDSEQSLAHILYNYKTGHDGSSSTDLLIPNLFHINPSMAQVPYRILELGTGMAGLSGWALALQYLQETDRDGVQNKAEEVRTGVAKPVVLTLTDGHVDGVLNNRINRILTQHAYSSGFATGSVEGRHVPKAKIGLSGGNKCAQYFEQIEVNMDVLLWTDDWNDGMDNVPDVTTDRGNVQLPSTLPTLSSQNICLISDCIHFQNFHSALAVTVLKYLKVGGTALFCQPKRGDSLDNFVKLLHAAGGTEIGAEKMNTTEFSDGDALLQYVWWRPDILIQQHERALREQRELYDADVHRPLILVVTKNRELQENDCNIFVEAQHRSRTSG